jgi:ribosomal protein L37E
MKPGLAAPPPFETRCPNCRVSYPIETRRCIHCGSPTARSAAPAAPEARLQRVQGAPPPAADEGEEDSAQLQRSGLARAMGLLWLVLAIAASLYRACTGGGGPG